MTTSPAVERLLARMKRLPVLSSFVLRFQHLLSSPNCNTVQIAELLSEDPVVTGRIIRLANSPLFHRYKEVTSVREAVVFLGLEQVREVVLSLSIISLFPLKAGEKCFDTHLFWHHSLSSAHIARHLAGAYSLASPEEAYTAGLLHDIGKILLNHFFPEEYGKVVQKALQMGGNYLAYEREVFGADHCEVGEALALKWALPLELTATLRFHHNPSPEMSPLVALVGFSNLFSKQIGFAFPWEFRPLIFSSDPFWRRLCQHREDLAKIDEELFTFQIEDVVPRIREIIAMSMKGDD